MAYLVEITYTCREYGCGRAATVELHNTYNATLGRYCLRHGKKREAELTANERQPDKDPTPSRSHD
jgi:hypothetical protein